MERGAADAGSNHAIPGKVLRADLHPELALLLRRSSTLRAERFAAFRARGSQRPHPTRRRLRPIAGCPRARRSRRRARGSGCAAARNPPGTDGGAGICSPSPISRLSNSPWPSCIASRPVPNKALQRRPRSLVLILSFDASRGPGQPERSAACREFACERACPALHASQQCDTVGKLIPIVGLA